MRARVNIEPMKTPGREAIIVTELPYQVNKARLIEKIADLVRDKKIEGISELRDESDKDGMRIAIELRRGEITDVVLNNLYKQTALQSVFGINMVALHDGQPKLLNLKQVLEAFLSHRREIVTRRTRFDLRKAVTGQLAHVQPSTEEPEHMLEMAELPHMEGHHISPLTGEDDFAPQGNSGQGAPASWGKVPRNAPCPCGSGKKFKHCHGRLS